MPRPRLKRLLRISLRMMLVLTTIFCIWLGLTMRQVRKQQAAVKWVRDMGGEVYYDHEFVVDDDLSDDCEEWIANPGIPGLRWLYDVVGVDYFASPVYVEMGRDIKDLSRLRDLAELRVLSLRSEPLVPGMEIRVDEVPESAARLQNDMPNLVINVYEWQPFATVRQGKARKSEAP